MINALSPKYKNFIKNKIKSFNRKDILVYGDLILDEYIFGKSNRLSPEAPVPVVKIQNKKSVPGGAANTANNIHSLGSNVVLVGFVGDDENGKKLLLELKRYNIDTKYIQTIKGYHTTTKSRVISQNQHVVRFDSEEYLEIPPREKNNLIKTILSITPSVDSIIISDYNKGASRSDISKYIIEASNKYKKKVFVDPKGNDFSKYKNCSVITPNLKELETILNKTINDIQTDVPIYAKRLLKLIKSDAVLVTLSEFGMYYVDNTDISMFIPATDVDVVDVSGAGDTAISTYVVAITNKCSVKESLIISTYASSSVIEKIGTSTTTIEEISNIIDRRAFKNG